MWVNLFSAVPLNKKKFHNSQIFDKVIFKCCIMYKNLIANKCVEYIFSIRYYYLMKGRRRYSVIHLNWLNFFNSFLIDRFWHITYVYAITSKRCCLQYIQYFNVNIFTILNNLNLERNKSNLYKNTLKIIILHHYRNFQKS